MIVNFKDISNLNSFEYTITFVEEFKKRFNWLFCEQECRNSCLTLLEARRLTASSKLFCDAVDQIHHVLHYLVPNQSSTDTLHSPRDLDYTTFEVLFMTIYLNSVHTHWFDCTTLLLLFFISISLQNILLLLLVR